MLSLEEVLQVRALMAARAVGSKDFGGPRPLYPDKLQSAVARQVAGFQGHQKYDKIQDVAATLLFGLASSHAFENGNKRTGFVSTLVLLAKNGQQLSGVDEDNLYALATDVVGWKTHGGFSGCASADEVVMAAGRWLRPHLQRRGTGYRTMKTSAFLQSLSALGCAVSEPDKSFVRITPPIGSSGRIVKMAYASAGRDIEAAYVKNIRTTLGLTAEHGVNEAGFFELEPLVDGFVQEHSRLLERLADA